MLFSLLLVFSLSQNNEKNKESPVMHTMREIRALSSNISSIQFDSNDSAEHFDKDAINLFLNESKIIGKQKSIFDAFGKVLNNEDEYLKQDCNNCIKILSQTAVFSFLAIRKSITNTVKFYQATSSDCSVKDVQLLFSNDGIINYTTEIYHLQGKSLNTFHFRQNVTFDKVQVNATSSNPSLLCLGKFSLLNH